MELPSILLQQHIGTVELWVDKLKLTAPAKELVELGGRFEEGLTVFISSIPLRLTLHGVEIRWEDLLSSEGDLAIKAISLYAELIRGKDPEMLKHVEELPRRKASLKQSLIEEQACVGGQLWYRDMNGVWQIEFVSFVGNRAIFKVLNNINRQGGSAVLSRMRLYLTMEEAIENKGGGNYVRRK